MLTDDEQRHENELHRLIEREPDPLERARLQIILDAPTRIKSRADAIAEPEVLIMLGIHTRTVQLPGAVRKRCAMCGGYCWLNPNAQSVRSARWKEGRHTMLVCHRCGAERGDEAEARRVALTAQLRIFDLPPRL